ncbi:MOSC domain-containing protein [Pseudomonas sp. N040]|uniref:MOSC domain-containing protein n=1 Tax=Pseudomonas sp. N040 TaxID=2785325 RepID=UPI0018A2B517|nr:MOSC domain-containing protein [Pseudomonas sp. N040]MBF7731407.1 MOSC domain-containing protein [Pseudomonas sp. N040]MBW7015051.1 MOSC domain-containing protein [Pseudomonas sp. N040]
MLQLTALYRYPLKSGASQVLPEATIDALGLAGDRRWMLVDAASGRFLSQRLLPQIGRIVAQGSAAGLQLSAPGAAPLQVPLPDPATGLRTVTLWADTFAVSDAGEAAAHWCSSYLQRACRLVHVPLQQARQIDRTFAEAGERVGFADGFPLLLIGQASLDDLAARVGRPLEMLRFRPNLVVGGALPYAEDGWKRIRIGALQLRVVKGCSRCIMTTLDPFTGERSTDREPLRTLEGYRQRDGQVYFGQNLIAEACGELRVGMPVEVLE